MLGDMVEARAVARAALFLMGEEARTIARQGPPAAAGYSGAKNA
jgi:hypothetical protein